MTETIRNQILVIRDTGRENMFNVPAIQRIAYEMDFFELVIFLEEHRDEYIRFILYGPVTFLNF